MLLFTRPYQLVLTMSNLALCSSASMSKANSSVMQSGCKQVNPSDLKLAVELCSTEQEVG